MNFDTQNFTLAAEGTGEDEQTKVQVRAQSRKEGRAP